MEQTRTRVATLRTSFIMAVALWSMTCVCSTAQTSPYDDQQPVQEMVAGPSAGSVKILTSNTPEDWKKILKRFDEELVESLNLKCSMEECIVKKVFGELPKLLRLFNSEDAGEIMEFMWILDYINEWSDDVEYLLGLHKKLNEKEERERPTAEKNLHSSLKRLSKNLSIGLTNSLREQIVGTILTISLLSRLLVANSYVYLVNYTESFENRLYKKEGRPLSEDEMENLKKNINILRKEPKKLYKCFRGVMTRVNPKNSPEAEFSFPKFSDKQVNRMNKNFLPKEVLDALVESVIINVSTLGEALSSHSHTGKALAFRKTELLKYLENMLYYELKDSNRITEAREIVHESIDKTEPGEDKSGEIENPPSTQPEKSIPVGSRKRKNTKPLKCGRYIDFSGELMSEKEDVPFSEVYEQTQGSIPSSSTGSVETKEPVPQASTSEDMPNPKRIRVEKTAQVPAIPSSTSTNPIQPSTSSQSFASTTTPNIGSSGEYINNILRDAFKPESTEVYKGVLKILKEFGPYKDKLPEEFRNAISENGKLGFLGLSNTECENYVWAQIENMEDNDIDTITIESNKDVSEACKRIGEANMNTNFRAINSRDMDFAHGKEGIFQVAIRSKDGEVNHYDLRRKLIVFAIKFSYLLKRKVVLIPNSIFIGDRNGLAWKVSNTFHKISASTPQPTQTNEIKPPSMFIPRRSGVLVIEATDDGVKVKRYYSKGEVYIGKHLGIKSVAITDTSSRDKIFEII